jgi:hypothetical protein
MNLILHGENGPNMSKLTHPLWTYVPMKFLYIISPIKLKQIDDIHKLVKNNDVLEAFDTSQIDQME